MANKVRVVITDYEYPDLTFERKVLSQLDVEVIEGQCRTEEEVIALAMDADGVICHYAPVTKKVIDALHNCKVICRFGTGVEIIDVEAATAKGIYVSNVPDYGVEEVSNHAMALLLSWSRKVVQFNSMVKSGKWDFTLGVPIHRYSHQTVGVLGFGRISRSFVKKAQSFGFRTVVYDPFVTEDVVKSTGAVAVSLNELLVQSDFLSVHVPLTKETSNLLNRDCFNRMKYTAVIINTSRGGVIHEGDLIEALLSGRIAGAALDVLSKEPIQKDHPFLSMDNVILTPHSAWYSEEAMQELRIKSAQNIVDVLVGGEPTYFVNQDLKKQRA